MAIDSGEFSVPNNMQATSELPKPEHKLTGKDLEAAIKSSASTLYAFIKGLPAYQAAEAQAYPQTPTVHRATHIRFNLRLPDHSFLRCLTSLGESEIITDTGSEKRYFAKLNSKKVSANYNEFAELDNDYQPNYWDDEVSAIEKDSDILANPTEQNPPEISFMHPGRISADGTKISARILYTNSQEAKIAIDEHLKEINTLVNPKVN